jgi:UV DNA damage endonuclease
MNIKYGLTCISEILKDNKQTYKTMTRAQFNKLGKKEGIKILSQRILHNMKFVSVVIKHCYDNNISHYRIPESVPLITDPTLKLKFKDLSDYNEIINSIKNIGITAKKYNIRIGAHPDQFIILCSRRKDVCDKSIIELNFVSWLFDTIGLPQSYEAPINIHPSCSVNNEETHFDIIDRFYKNLMKCDKGVQKRLTLENEDKSNWTCETLLSAREYLKIKYNFELACVYDNLHDKCNPSLTKNINWLEKFKQTWPTNIIPVMHWSEGGMNGKKRSHVEYITENVGKPVDNTVIWELEVKGKDKAIIKLLKE